MKVIITGGAGFIGSHLADISKAKQLLDWHPKVSFEDGIEVLLSNIDDWDDAPIWDKNSIAKATEKWFEYLS